MFCTARFLLSVIASIKKAEPQLQEKIGYGIPTFTLYGNVVHFGAYPKHIGFYPGASGIKSFTKELSAYKTSKGTVQFPINEPLPFPLITKIVKFRVKENIEKAGGSLDIPADLVYKRILSL